MRVSWWYWDVKIYQLNFALYMANFLSRACLDLSRESTELFEASDLSCNVGVESKCGHVGHLIEEQREVWTRRPLESLGGEVRGGCEWSDPLRY